MDAAERLELIRTRFKKHGLVSVKPQGLHLASTGEESAVKPVNRCEYKRDGNWRSNNHGVSQRPKELAALLPKEKPGKDEAFKSGQRHRPHALTLIAEKWLHAPKLRAKV